jgi:hypothetical protein
MKCITKTLMKGEGMGSLAEARLHTTLKLQLDKEICRLVWNDHVLPQCVMSEDAFLQLNR